MWLLVTEQQYQILQDINNSHTDRKIMPKLSNHNNWIVSNDLLSDCENAGDTWYDWKDWLVSLSPTNDIPAPVVRPVKDKNKK